jgi:hypothetical protein
MMVKEGEKERTLKWRYGQLRKAGYDRISADLIAHSKADLHVACDLATKVDHHTAVKILT